MKSARSFSLVLIVLLVMVALAAAYYYFDLRTSLPTSSPTKVISTAHAVSTKIIDPRVQNVAQLLVGSWQPIDIASGPKEPSASDAAEYAKSRTIYNKDGTYEDLFNGGKTDYGVWTVISNPSSEELGQPVEQNAVYLKETDNAGSISWFALYDGDVTANRFDSYQVGRGTHFAFAKVGI
jgi:hypothetical protein